MTINRKIIYFLLSTVAILILFGCTKTNEHVSYHSTASIPHSISSNLTIMKYIKLDKSLFSQRQKYGVATAVDIKDDTSKVSYVLFAPSKYPRSVNNLNDMLMSMSVPLTTDQAKILSSKLKVLAGNWGKIWVKIQKKRVCFLEKNPLMAKEHSNTLTGVNMRGNGKII